MQRIHRLRRATVLFAAIATAGLVGLALSTPAQAAPVKPGGSPAGPVKPSDAETGAVKQLCSTPKSPKEARCFALARTDVASGTGIKPNATPSGYGPADLQSAYALPSATGGAGQTVAIVDAFDNPNAEADLAVYRAQFGLPACTTANGCFRKLNQNGEASPLPAPNAGWAGEISLDVQMVSAVCPSCDILLVEANTNFDTDLYAAINKAVELGAKYVSNSWGGPEDATQTVADESTFNHPGVVITASSGDEGYVNQFPASSKYVTSIGGTALTRVTGGRGWAETVWSNGFGATGSGCSSFEDKPSFQTDPGCAKRAYADVSAVADPATGVSVYNTYQAPGWQVYGGTSASSPIIAGVYALAGPVPSGTYPNSFPYQAGVSAGLNDVTSGSNGSCGGSYLCTAGPGYDGPTGLGTPNGIRAFAPAQPYGTVAGTVTDAGDGHPLAGASVSAGSATDMTDAAGHYDLALPVGTYDVTAAAYGYASKTNAGVTVTQGATTTSDFALSAVPKATVSGIIRDGSGHGWPLYATVTVNGVPGGPVYTDPATGRYSVSLPVGQTYTLHVAANYPGYQAVDATVPLSSGDVVKDVSVPVDAKACVAPGYAIHNYGLSETFDTADTPAGWSVVNNTADGGWGFTDIGNRGNLTGGSGGFAMVDSDKLGVGKTQDTELRTPVLDLTDRAAPVIAFNSDYRAFGTSTADVDLSLDSGATWQNVLHHDVSVRGPILEEIAIPQAAGKTGVQVRFHYRGTFAYWWEVDNVLVGQRACEPVHGGLVVGNVTDHNTGNGINGATVTSVDHPADTTKTAATPNDPNLGDGFYWLFSSLTGAHPFSATQSPYLAQTKTVNVATDWATRADFTLPAGQVTVTPTKIEKTVKMGDTATAKVTLRNTGTQPADVQIGEQDGGFKLLLAQGSGAPVQNINGTYTPHRLATGGVTPKVTSPVKPSAAPYAAPWTDIANYPTPIMDNAVGVSDGKLYSAAGTNGTAIVGTGSVFDPATGAWSAIASMKTAREKPAGAFLGGKFYVVGGWASNGTPEPSLEIYDPASNSWSAGASVPTAFAAAAAAVLDGKLYVVGGCDAAVCGKTNVYVYTPSSNSWSQVADYPQPIAWQACGGIAGQLYCAGGTTDAADTKVGYSYNPATNAWSPIADLPIDLWASSFTAANGVLLVSGGVTNGQTTLTNQGFAYDPTSRAWTAIANSNNTVYRGGGACGFYKVGGSIGQFNAIAKSEVLPGLDQCGGNADVPWLSEDPTSLTIAPGKSATVTVTLDASVGAVNQPGAYAAQLTFRTNTPYQVTPVDVTMNVTPPKTWGKIAGTVTGVKCDGSTAPLAGATVQIDSWAQHFTLRTDASGNYALWLDSRNNPLDVIVAKDGWQPKYKQWKIKAGQTTTANWSLSAVC
jgi:N-acetylneuraminic acid mutarotase